MINNLNTDELQKTKKQLHDMMKGLNPIMERMTSGLTPHLEKLMQSEVEQEKRIKINRKAATMQLLKNGNVMLKFDDPQDVKSFFNTEK